MQTVSRKFLIPALLLVLLLVTFLIYAPGLTGDFIFDDYPNIVRNEAALLTELTPDQLRQAFFSGIATSITRPLSMITFAVNSYFTGLDPFYFKLTNILIHLLICPGVYFLSKELLLLAPSQAASQQRVKWLALLVTAIWALHPLNVSSVLYVVQRMNQLSALVVVYTLLYYCRFRKRSECSTGQALRALLVIGLAIVGGALFKENAILLVPIILTLEFFLLEFKPTCRAQELFIRLFGWLYVALPAFLFVLLLVFTPESILGDYGIRNFTLTERLLTEARALWMYAGMILMPDTRDLVFYYDNYEVSRGLFEPITTLASVLGLAGVLAFCIRLRRKLPVLCFGIAFFLAGHALESTIVSLELVFEHRNYLPAFGLIFAGVYTLMNLPRAFLGQAPAAAFLVLFLAFQAHGTYAEAKKWSNTFTHLESMVQRNPDSHRANYSLGYFYNRLAASTPDNSAMFDAASFYHRRAAQQDVNAIRAHVGVLLADSQNEKPLDPFIVEQLANRLQTLNMTHRTLREFVLLPDCLYRGFCKIDKATFGRLITALARNKVSNPLIVQSELALMGIAVATVFGALEDGMAILYLARSVRPELTLIDLQLIQLELRRSNYLQAQQLIEEAYAKGGSQALLDDLAELDAELARNQPAP